MKKRIIIFFAGLWHLISKIWVLLILGVIAGIFGNLITDYITAGSISFVDPKKLKVVSFVLSHLNLVSIILIFIVVLIFCAYWANRFQRKVLQPVPEPPPLLSDTQNHRNRELMIERVRSLWITGILEQSLEGAPPLTLRLREQPDLVPNPWRLTIQESDRNERELPLGTHITQVYDYAGRELLLLGEPGSGKTTLLLELARDLLKRAQNDDSQPIPVVFNLSSWMTKQLALADWIIEELNVKYQVPYGLGRTWIDNNEILPLLDGLDEVSLNALTSCVDAINTYKQERMVSIVVCCRLDQYLAQKRRLSLHSAVIIQPLTIEQIDSYLSVEGEQLQRLRIAIHEDMDIQTLASTPLMLSVLAKAYDDKLVEGLQAKSFSEMQQQQVFADYVRLMLQRRSINARYTFFRTKYWLTWLARQMVQHNQAEFYMEQMQPDWLPKNHLYPLYYVVVVRLCIILLSGLGTGVVLGLVGRIFDLGGPVIGPIGGCICGLVFGLTNRVEPEIKPTENVTWSWVNMWQRLVKNESLRNGIVVGLIMVLVTGSVFGLSLGLTMGLTVGLISGVFSDISHEMQDKHISFSTLNQGICRVSENSIFVGFVFGLNFCLIGGLASALVLVLVFSLIGGLLGGLAVGLLTGLAFGLLGCLAVGLVSGLITKFSRKMLHRSPARVGLISGLVFGLVSSLVIGLKSDLFIGLAASLILSTLFGASGILAGKLANRILNNPNISAKVINGLVVGLNSGLMFGLVMVLLNGLIADLTFSIVMGLILGLVGGFISGLVSGVFSQGVSELEFSKAIRRFWRSIWKRLIKFESLKNALIVGLVIGLTSGIAFGPIKGLIGGLSVGLLSGLIFEFTGGLSKGLSSEILDKHSLTIPNQGIRSSARNSIRVGLLFGSINCLLFGFVGWLFFGSGLFWGLIAGTIGGTAAGLLNGGIACIQHYSLRLLLWYSGCMPLNYSRFLDYAAERILLRKVGGGYIFVHSLLLAYVATLDNTINSDKK